METARPSEETVSLRRALGLPLITLYGIGTILGAGIYVLIGKVVAASGYYAPISFLLASLIVAFSAFSYAELASRFPRSAGEAVYVQQAFGRDWLYTLVGMAVIITGTISSATITTGFVGYMKLFVDVPDWLIILLLVASLGAIAAIGVHESVLLASIITLIEVAGILLVIGVALSGMNQQDLDLKAFIPKLSLTNWLGITSGAFLAFYAFIGFEDMVNMAEEVRDPVRNMPRSIIIALLITSLLYFAVAFAALNALPLDVLATSEAPFAEIIRRNSTIPPAVMGLISLVAIVNGALIQIIMAARVLYGMASQGRVPGVFAHINRVTRTPLEATAAASVVVLVLALWLPIVTLAGITSVVVLVTFTLVNLALLRLKMQERKRAEVVASGIVVPLAVPMTGALLCVGFVLMQLPALWT